MGCFIALNDEYKAKFDFPFILAVRNANKATIIASFARRLGNGAAAELTEAIAQVHKIAWMRLREAVAPNPCGFLTCHVLDTARGCPAAGMRIEDSAEVRLSPGDHLFIAAGQPHWVTWTARDRATVWLAVHLG